MTFSAGGLNLNPLQSLSKKPDPKEGFAKSGMNRADFDKWVKQNVVKDGVKYGQSTAGGSYTMTGTHDATAADLEALWSIYQQYGTLDPNEGYAVLAGHHTTGGTQYPDTNSLSNTIEAAGGPSASAPAAKGAAPAPVTNGTPAPDAASALSKAATDPTFAAILQKTLGQGAGGTIQYWQNLGVDPDAPVFGGLKDTKTTNTMDKSGRLVHGHGDSLGIGVTGTTQTADKWLKGLYTMSPQDLADLQHRLYDQGWYKGTDVNNPGQIQFGRPDAATLQAYGSVLAEGARYNAAGKHISIDGVIDLGGTIGTADGKGAPFEKTNPADLDAALKASFQQETGHDPGAGDLAGYHDQYLGQEDAARRQMIADQGTNTTEGITGPPSPSAGADAYIDQHNTADKVAYGAAVRQQAFFSMLKDPTG